MARNKSLVELESTDSSLSKNVVFECIHLNIIIIITTTAISRILGLSGSKHTRAFVTFFAGFNFLRLDRILGLSVNNLKAVSLTSNS